MSAQVHEITDAPFDDLLAPQTNDQHIDTTPSNNTDSNSDNQQTNDHHDVDINMNDEEEIDYFGDYNTSTIDNDITSGPLYNPHSIQNGSDNNNNHKNGNNHRKHDTSNKHNVSNTNSLDYDAAYNEYINDGIKTHKPYKKKRYRPFYNHNRDRYSRSKYNQSYRKRCMLHVILFIFFLQK